MTWEIKPEKAVQTDTPLIVGEQEDLLWYDGPILFTGLNIDGTRILASLLDVNRPQSSWRFIHSVIDDALYESYVQKELDYPTLISRARQIFIVEWLNDGNSLIFPVTFDDIPKDYLPREGAFYPVD